MGRGQAVFQSKSNLKFFKCPSVEDQQAGRLAIHSGLNLRSVVFRMWPPEQQHQHPLQNFGPHPRPAETEL